MKRLQKLLLSFLLSDLLLALQLTHMSNPYKPFASQLFHTLNKKNLREMRNQQFKYTES